MINERFPLMPKATAMWMLENTGLSFKQIANFCKMHELEIRSMADGELYSGIVGINPIELGQLTEEEINKCTKDPSRELQHKENEYFDKTSKAQGRKYRYTPVARRQDKPDAIYWLIKNLLEITDVEIVKLIGTTKNMIMSIRKNEHWNIQNIRARDPVILGLCTQSELDKLINKDAAISKKLDIEQKNKPSNN
ncbi:cell cycle transcriptional regulator TrcR [Rickettsia endosymbiont of Cardiosporidium cionae]|uniref:cell cycle transcriptional regulator TrcR n=1 Tax=Rickettsia endosymbiont of Cardiosporidium cionae TaxID=2777155 RepID=UPI0018950FBF|nr:cell cycle transcriptional regulator TrcR [Rickettsia endosymbiont of Cardiosporidium cionae]KAF8818459.1 hypothetical protein IHI24_000550 [Rickettsia endosymbiont of Cardiosporidium cionae]